MGDCGICRVRSKKGVSPNFSLADYATVGSLPRPPRLACPPLRPARRASSADHSCAVPLAWAARPPLLAISRCFSADIEAKPRRALRISNTVTSHWSKVRHYLRHNVANRVPAQQAKGIRNLLYLDRLRDYKKRQIR